MKYLSDYTQDKQSEVFNRYGAFFAFSNKQFDEKKKEGVDYVSLGESGLIAPKGAGNEIMEALEAIQEEAIKQDLKENTTKGVIHRELANYECQLTGNITDAVEALEPYGVTEKQVIAEWKEYYQMCIDNNYF